MYLIQIHDVADFGGQFFLRSDFGAFIFAQNFVDQAAGGGIQHRNFFGHQPGHEIIRAVQAVAAGDEFLSPVATRSLIAQYVRSPGPRPAVSKEASKSLALLTEREREVLELVGRGLSNQEIAEKFFISPHTAKTHVNRIMSKIYAHDRAQLVILAYESGLLVPGE